MTVGREQNSDHSTATLERDLAEAALRESEEQYRTLAEAASDSIIRIDETSTIKFVNSAATRTFGYAVDEMVGNSLTMLMPEELRPQHKAGLGRYLATGRRTLNWKSVETEGLHKDGRRFPIEISFGEYTRDEKRFFIGIARDISQRKLAEQARRESEENFRLLANSISQLAWMTHPDGYIFWYNQRWYDYTGTTPDEMMGTGWRSVHHPSYVDRVAEKFQRHLNSGEEWEDTFLLRSATGEYRWFLSRATPIRDAEGNILRWFGTNTDIDEVRRAEDILRLSREELAMRVRERTSELEEATMRIEEQARQREIEQQLRLDLLGRLLTSQEDERHRIARDMHDHFGQQLTALRLQLESLGEMCDQPELYDKINETKKIAEQVDSDVSFLVWELRPASLKDVGLKAAIANYVEKWAEQFDVTAEFHGGAVDEDEISAEAQTCIYRIAQEALNNVNKYAEASKVSLLLERRNAELVMIVEDDGKGFAADDANGDEGFGLIGMRERAGLLGGTVDIESQPGEGTTIFVHLPLSLSAQNVQFGQAR